MSTTAKTRRATPDLDDDVQDGPHSEMVATIEIGPGNLDGYLRLADDKSPRIKYRDLDGSLTLVSPSFGHDGNLA